MVDVCGWWSPGGSDNGSWTQESRNPAEVILVSEIAS